MNTIATFEKSEIKQDENLGYLVFSKNNICLLHTGSITEAFQYAEKFNSSRMKDVVEKMFSARAS